MDGGKPPYDSPYGFVDWYTWTGWLEAYSFHLLMSFFKEFIVDGFVVGVFIVFFMTTTKLPFCTEGDAIINLIFYKYDICKNIDFLSATFSD